MEGQITLQLADYMVVLVVLLIPLCIGIYFAVRDKGRATREEYLLGGRRMAVLPVSLSIYVSFMSAIAIIGMPSEMFMHGSIYIVFFVGIVLAYVVAYFTVAPLMHPLQVTSVYEYLEMRFQSKAIRRFVSVVGMMQMFFYMMVALLAPGLTLEAAAGIPIWMSVVIIGVTGTVYTCVGGFKSVVWTDVFQTFIFLVGILLIVVRIAMYVGGLGEVWTSAQNGGRINFNRFSLDPRVRYTWWGAISGGFFLWFFNLCSQPILQRITALSTAKKAGQALLLNIPIYVVTGLLLVMSSWCLYAYLFHIQCDPLQSGLIRSPDQLVPFVVLHSLQHAPGLPGLFMAAVFSGSLSTLSSGINSLAANAVEDILKHFLQTHSERTLTLITKFIVLLFGTVITSLAYALSLVNIPVVQIAASVQTTLGSVVFGVFLLGCTIPWGNKYGAVSGLVVSLCVSLWIMVGGMMYSTPWEKLPPVPSGQCFNSTFSSHFIGGESNHTIVLYHGITTPKVQRSSEYGFFLYDLSYTWYGFIGVLVSFITGLGVSKLTTSLSTTQAPCPELILPSLRRFWNLRDANIYDKCQDKETEEL